MSNARARLLVAEEDSQLALPGLDSEPEWTWTQVEEETTLDRFEHTTVMREETVRALAVRDGGTYVDATLGGGGHAEAILDAADTARVIGIDRDTIALAAAGLRLARFGDRVTLIHDAFGNLESALLAHGVGKVDGVCADLGVSSPQLDEAERGMSFRREGPIDMRMNTTDGETALEMIARMDDEELANVIFKYGEERRSRRIARSIKRAHDDGELHTTLDLRRAIVRATGPVRHGGVDPATRTFQGIRIAVNAELDQLEALLAALPKVLAPGGVGAIISFHSLEDRLVKHAFHVRETWAPLWKKPLGASADEQTANGRSRSAKLRAARLIDHSVEGDP